jgi:hypothetical protein
MSKIKYGMYVRVTCPSHRGKCNKYGHINVIWTELLTYVITKVKTSRRIRWAQNVADFRDRKLLYRVLVGKPERKRPLGIFRCRWKDNIKVNLQVVGWRHGFD